MNNTLDVEMYKLLSTHFGEEEAEKFVGQLNEKLGNPPLNKSETDRLKDVFLTKQDKIDLLSRMDSHFKWLTGIMIATISLAVTFLKLTSQL